jgi:hypothetical protein
MRWWIWLEVGSEDAPWWQRLVLGLAAALALAGLICLAVWLG